MSSSVLSMFSSKSFIVSGLTFRSLIHFEFIFIYGVRKCSNFIPLHAAVQFPQHYLLKRMSLPYCIVLPPLSKIRYPQLYGFISGLSILFNWSIFLFLCQYHSVSMTVALQYNLKSGRLIPPAPFFFLKAALAIWGLLCFHMNCENDYTTKCNLQIQCDPYQITNGIFHRTRTKNFTVLTEIQKTPNSESSLEKEEQSWRNQPS